MYDRFNRNYSLEIIALNNQKITIHTEDVAVLLNALSSVVGVFNMPNDESNGLAWSCQKDDTPFGEVSVMCYAPLEEVFPS